MQFHELFFKKTGNGINFKACFLPKDEVDPEVTAAAAAAIEAEVDTAVTEVVFIVDDDTDPEI